MAFPSVDDAVDTAILGGPLAGLYANRLDPDRQADVRQALARHLSGLAEPGGDGMLLPAEIRIVIAAKNP